MWCWGTICASPATPSPSAGREVDCRAASGPSLRRAHAWSFEAQSNLECALLLVGVRICKAAADARLPSPVRPVPTQTMSASSDNGRNESQFLGVARPKEIEIASLIGLQHMVDVQAWITAQMLARGRRETAPPGFQFQIVDQ